MLGEREREGMIAGYENPKNFAQCSFVLGDRTLN